MAREELFVDRLGRVVLAFFETAGALAVFAGRAVVEAFRPPYEFREILRHLYQFGLGSTQTGTGRQYGSGCAGTFSSRRRQALVTSG